MAMSNTAEIREALDLCAEVLPYAITDDETKWNGEVRSVVSKVDRAIALLSDMEREEEPVAWLNEYMGLTMNDRSKRMHDAEGTKHGYTIPLYRHPSPTAADAKERPWNHEIIAAAVECFDLGPEDQDAVISFGMKLQDMEDAERKPQPLTVEQIAQTVWWWAIDAKMVNATTEPYYLNIDLRDRLTTLLNTSATMADLDLDRITDENRSFGE